MKPTAEEIQKLVGRQLGLRDVRLEDDIAADLGAVSADIINIVATIEDLYHVIIGEEELTAVDRQYLQFGNDFEREFVGQGQVVKLNKDIPRPPGRGRHRSCL